MNASAYMTADLAIAVADHVTHHLGSGYGSSVESEMVSADRIFLKWTQRNNDVCGATLVTVDDIRAAIAARHGQIYAEWDPCYGVMVFDADGRLWCPPIGVALSLEAAVYLATVLPSAGEWL